MSDVGSEKDFNNYVEETNIYRTSVLINNKYNDIIY